MRSDTLKETCANYPEWIILFLFKKVNCNIAMINIIMNFYERAGPVELRCINFCEYSTLIIELFLNVGLVSLSILLNKILNALCPISSIQCSIDVKEIGDR